MITSRLLARRPRPGKPHIVVCPRDGLEALEIDPKHRCFLVAVGAPGDGRRALSLAMGVCDAFGLRREQVIFRVGAEEAKVSRDTAPPSPWVYGIAKSTRAAVVG
jgi:hypothetical protein